MALAEKKKPKRWRAWLLELAIFVALFFGLRAYMSYGTASGMAPPLSGVRVDNGQAVSLDTYQGRPMLVHFWASWCGICGLMRGSVAELAGDYPVLTVAMQSGEAGDIRAYLREHGVSLPVLADPSGALARSYGVRGVPASFVLDAQGRVRFVEVGYTSGLGLRARLWLADWLPD